MKNKQETENNILPTSSSYNGLFVLANQPYNETSRDATVLGQIRDTKPPSCCHGVNVKVELQFAVEFGLAQRLW
ncbi:hypothetical protein M0804_003131 [Polistes exclamans]|nr:hypothetical protein M0804_003131 [Polistes exclamans]